MKNLIEIIKTTVFGGLVMIVPLSVLLLAVAFLLENLIRLNTWALDKLPFIPSHPTLNLLAAAITLLLVCLAAGVLVKTQLGISWAQKLDAFVYGKVPMYGLLRNMTKRFTGENILELSPAEISLRGGDAKVIGFIIEHLPDERVAVYVPSTPVIGHGQIYVVPEASVVHLAVPPKVFLEVMTSWGSGARAMYDQHLTAISGQDEDGMA